MLPRHSNRPVRNESQIPSLLGSEGPPDPGTSLVGLEYRLGSHLTQVPGDPGPDGVRPST